MGAVTFLQIYATPKRVYAIAGSQNGSLGLWDALSVLPARLPRPYADGPVASTQTLLAMFELFNGPVLTVCDIPNKYLAINAGGSIAVLSKEAIVEQ